MEKDKEIEQLKAELKSYKKAVEIYNAILIGLMAGQARRSKLDKFLENELESAFEWYTPTGKHKLY